MAIPDEDVARVRAATDIVALVGEHTALKRVGRRFVGLCPFHSEKSGSFNVNGEEGFYYCFGCQAKGDAITFVRAIDGCDFVEAIERLAARAGITITNNEDVNVSAERGRRQKLYGVLGQAVDFYHQYLLTDPGAGAGRQYLRSRGYDGEVVRQFQIGFAPRGYDQLAKVTKAPVSLLKEAGLAYEDRNGRAQDAFRERIIFPIFEPGGKPIALGGRVMPEVLRKSDRDPGPKYRNSPETPVYKKSRTLYGLNWAKTEISHTGEAIVCEGYTDVIGFFRAGMARAVATCGTALTEEHFRLLGRFARRIVLAFDADAAGQNAAARLYDWERRHELELAVAALPPGSDPADLAGSDPQALRDAITNARPFLGFRIDRALSAADLSTPEGRSRAVQIAIAAIAEHPNDLVRDEYLRAVADRTQYDPDRLRHHLDERRDAIAKGLVDPAPTRPRRQESPQTTSDPGPTDDDAPPHDDDWGQDQRPARRHAPAREDLAGRDALLLAIHRPDTVGDAFDEVLFLDPVQRSAFRALVNARELHVAIDGADEETAELLLRLSVTDVPDDVEVNGTLVALTGAAGTRALRGLDAEMRIAQQAGEDSKFFTISEQLRWLREELEYVVRDPFLQPGLPSPAVDASRRLVAWLRQRQTEG